MLPPGATLAVYSDGLEDLEDERGESFGPARVAALFRDIAQQEPGDALAAMQRQLSAFAGKALPPDDQTVAMLRRSPDAVAVPVAVPAQSSTRPLGVAP